MVCAIMGTPPRGSRFLRGKRFEPPLAGITARFPPGADMAGVYVGDARPAVKPARDGRRGPGRSPRGRAASPAPRRDVRPARDAPRDRGTFLSPWLAP